jgi:hypothetical protein
MSVPLLAQTFEDTFDPQHAKVKSLLGKGNVINGYGGTDIRVSDFFGTNAFLVGGHGGLLVNRSYFLGLGAYGLVSQSTFETQWMDGTEKEFSFYMGYAGLVMGGTLLHKELVHLNFPVFMGAGLAEITDQNFFQNGLDTDFTIEDGLFFVLEPTAEIEINITSNFRLAFGATYRWVTGSELQYVTDEDISGISGSLSLRVGRF